jgi:hypothetical protein
MRSIRLIVLVLAAAACVAIGAPDASLAQPAGVDPGKDCHSIRRCQYGRGGGYRGCISAYSCRQCQFVASNCTIDGQRRVCRQLRCGWGAA